MTAKRVRVLFLGIILSALVIGIVLIISSSGVLASDRSHFTHRELTEDTEQLGEIIEITHPDPYSRGGGKIAFHRRYQQVLDAIPQEGLERDEFARILRPFIASVHDGHTLLENAYSVDKLYPGGVPLLLDVVEESLYVAAVPGEEHKALIGARLLSVEGVPLEDLIERQKGWQGIENGYHALYTLSAQSLRYAPYLQDLLPEWERQDRIRVELRLPAGEIRELDFDLPVSAETLYLPQSQMDLPVPGESGFLYDFPDPERSVAYLRIDHMSGYREMFERRNDSDAKDYPSATETFRELVAEMKDRGTEMLIVDLRNCVGGNSTMADILVYFIYGKETLGEVKGSAYAAGGGAVLKRPPNTKKRAYDFEWDFSGNPERFDRLAPQVPAYLEEFAKGMPTFYAEYETGKHAGYFRPEEVVVLVSPKTFSSGFILARYLALAGATLVGTPSGQAINWYCDPIHLNLKNSDLRVLVSTSYCMHLIPRKPELRDFLPVHHSLTYETLQAYQFDPHAPVLYALDRLGE